MGSKRTVEQVADLHGLSVSAIKAYLRRNFASPGRDFAGGDAGLTREEVLAIGEAIANGELTARPARDHDSPAPVETPTRAISSSDVDAFASPALRESDGEARGQARFTVFAHKSVLDLLERSDSPKNLKKNLTRRIQELMAHGEANKTKGVKGPNAGYLRLPAGGTHGQQYYLWFLNRGDRVKKQDTRDFYAKFPERARILRAVRHHDDTEKPQLLDVEDFDDYVELDPQLVMSNPDAEGLEDPLTPEQRKIVESGASIRFIKGQPGAGKTTSLHEVTRRLSGRLLYLTWSSGLAERAREWLNVSAPANLDIEIWTFGEFVERLDPSASPTHRLPLSARVAALRDHLAPYRGQLGAWARGDLRAGELYTEMHAYIFGAALPVDFRGRRAVTEGRALREDDYTKLREQVLGPAATAQAYKAATKMLSAEKTAELFPELHDARARALDLAEGRLSLDPELFAFDWVLIDEVQDLTPLEQWLVIDAAARAGIMRGVRAGLFIAGDEAQTVRPTAFEWGALKDLVSARFGPHAVISDYELNTNLRAPQDLALFINKIQRRLLLSIDKGSRPRGRQEDPQTEATVSRLLQVTITAEEREALVQSFAAQPGAALISTADIIPAHWAEAAQKHGTVIWTSEQAKGLEFPVVAVLDVPETIAEIRSLAAEAERSPVCAELARSAIDRFLVAVSRSNETLVLLSAAWDDSAQTALEGLVDDETDGFLGLVSRSDLEDLLGLDAADARDQISRLLAQSERLQDGGEISTALRLAQNANGLLGRQGRPGAAGDELRRSVRRRLGVLLAHRALNARDAVALRLALKKLRLAGRNDAADALLRIAQVIEKDDPGELGVQQSLEQVVERLVERLVEPTLVPPVTSFLLDYLEALKSVPKTPKGREVLARALALLASAAPRSRKRFRKARQRLLFAILDSLADANTPAAVREFEELRGQLDQHPGLPVIDARHAEATGAHVDAAQRWQALGKREAAMRCIRRAGDLPAIEAMARAMGEADDIAQLGWGLDVLRALERRPPGQIHEADLAALRAAIDRFLASVERREG